MIAGKVALVLQARIGSTRLPGKVLAPIAGATVLAYCITRLQASGVGPVVVATTTLPADDAVAAEAGARGATAFRGSSDDVLGRMVAAADATGAEFVIRATADNPAIDVDSVVRVMEHLRATFADHAVEAGLPYGCAVEAVRTMALRDAAARAIEPGDREHVTTFLRRKGSGFKCVTRPAPAGARRPDLRFTVDTPADLEYMRRLFGEAGCEPGRVVPLAGLIAVADALAGSREVA